MLTRKRNPTTLDNLNNYSKAKKKSSLSKKFKSIILIFLWGGFLLTIIGFVVGIALLAKFTEDLPDPTKPFQTAQSEPSMFYDRNGKFLYKQVGDVDRDLIQSLSEVPDKVKWSFLLAENKRYYEDSGVDPAAIIRCLYITVVTKGNCGGSTITQQVLKNTVFKDNPYDNTTRKVKEIILALRLNQLYTKDQILQFYLNEVDFSPTSYGLKAAAKHYFNKSLDQLDLAESTFLAGLPQNWTLYSPDNNTQIVCRIKEGDGSGQGLPEGKYNVDENGNPTTDLDGNPVIKAKAYKCRQLYVLNQFTQETELLKSHGVEIDSAQIETAKNEELVFNFPKIEKNAPHFIDYTISQITSDGSKYLDDKPFTKDQLNTGGYKIYTTIDLDMQNIAQKAVSDGATANIKSGAYNAAMGAIDVQTGEVLMMIGSKGYDLPSEGKNAKTGLSKFDGQVNVMNSLQQPGSSMKPISELAGFESGILYPSAFTPDVCYKVGTYCPQNAFGGGVGYKVGSTDNFLRAQLRASYNKPAYIAEQIMGYDLLYNNYLKLGYTTFKSVSDIVPVTILGANDILPMEHINAYATMGNLGVMHPIQTLLRIEDKNGKILWQYDPTKVANQVIDPRAAYMMNDVIKDTPGKYYSRTLGLIKEFGGYIQSSKTGTTNDSIDNWFVGYSKTISMGVWAGNNDNSLTTYRADGGSLALPIYKDVMKQLLEKYPDKYKKNDDWVRPSGISDITVCNYSGKPATSACGTNVSKSMFISDKIPAVDDSVTKVKVCTDIPVSSGSAQAKKNADGSKMLARQIDIDYGYAMDDVSIYVKMPNSSMQSQIDKLLKQSSNGNLPQCDTDYQSLGLKPTINLASPVAGQSVIQGGQITINATATGALGDVVSMKTYLDNQLIINDAGNAISRNVTLPIGTSVGSHIIKVEATDVGGTTNFTTASINVTSAIVTLDGSIIINSPPNGSSYTVGSNIIVTATYSGTTPASSVVLKANGSIVATMTNIGGSNYQATYTPNSTGHTIINVMYVTTVGNLNSNNININVN